MDGRPLPGATDKGFIPVSASADTEQSVTLTGLPQRDITLSLVARAGDLEGTRAIIQLKFRGAPSVAIKGSLYAVVVGVGTFKDPNVPASRWAARDATRLRRRAQTPGGPPLSERWR